VSKRRSSWKDHVQATFSSFFISKIVFEIYLLSEGSQVEVIAYAWVTLYIFSGVIFDMLPVFEFSRKVGVQKGKSYIHYSKIIVQEYTLFVIHNT